MNMIWRTMKLSLLMALLVIMATGCKMCAKPPVGPEGAFDTPAKHIEWGFENLEKGKLDAAYKEFQRALALAPESKANEKAEKAPAHAGLGLYYAMKNDFKKAKEHIDKAKSWDSKCWQAYMVQGRVYAIEKPKNWNSKAQKAFEKAVKYTKSKEDKSMCYYWWGKTAKTALDFDSAEKAFRKVIELDVAGWVSKADKDWKLIQMIQRAAPGTKVGKKIALIEKISRADCAILFMQELKLEKLLSERVKKEYDTKYTPPADSREFKTETVSKADACTDIENSWAKHDIEKVIHLPIRGLKPYPDHTFKPQELITRANFATMIEDIIIIITGDQKLRTKYLGEESHFPDVRSDHFAYNAINVCVTRQILGTKGLDAEFGLMDSVAGAEALLAIRKLRDNLRL
ncbi:tetratricopeptide repeat protein [candidate division CSSED10-310 bacterium]|uniref:Tetratricopeptide repeat protein n=1 Tax=candidate division CSSED10-310 bacterium TaxID=2855610 RepID=A0ABV6Z4T5_UNCC1